MKLYNSFSNTLEKFVSREKNKVSLYVCGITPYDTTHLGHAFTYIHFDVLVRFLKHLNYEVEYTQNVTDIDDDILRKAKETGQNWQELGNFWTKRFTDDMKALNILPPTNYVKATGSIQSMVNIIEVLLESKIAYQNGENVYFDVTTFKTYGNLSKLSESKMKVLLKERGGDPNDPFKKHSLDFVLWSKSKKDEPSWTAPFGSGRPGWHIECSSMILDTLGEQIDIHGGGKDLIFPHHESEIAQSESFTGKSPFVKYWMHTEMLEYKGEKMAKSVGNLVMVSELLKKYSANAIRYLLLSKKYRDTWEFTFKDMDKAQTMFDHIQKRIKLNKSSSSSFKKNVEDALSNDLDTPAALNIIEKNIDEFDSTELKHILLLLGFAL